MLHSSYIPLYFWYMHAYLALLKVTFIMCFCWTSLSLYGWVFIKFWNMVKVLTFYSCQWMFASDCMLNRWMISIKIWFKGEPLFICSQCVPKRWSINLLILTEKAEIKWIDFHICFVIIKKKEIDILLLKYKFFLIITQSYENQS